MSRPNVGTINEGLAVDNNFNKRSKEDCDNFADYNDANETERGTLTKKRRRCVCTQIYGKNNMNGFRRVQGTKLKLNVKYFQLRSQLRMTGSMLLNSTANQNGMGQYLETVASSKRMQAFFNSARTPQAEKVTVAELTQIFHGVKHHSSYLQQDCSLKVLKAVIDD